MPALGEGHRVNISKFRTQNLCGCLPYTDYDGSVWIFRCQRWTHQGTHYTCLDCHDLRLLRFYWLIRSRIFIQGNNTCLHLTSLTLACNPCIVTYQTIQLKPFLPCNDGCIELEIECSNVMCLLFWRIIGCLPPRMWNPWPEVVSKHSGSWGAYQHIH